MTPRTRTVRFVALASALLLTAAAVVLTTNRPTMAQPPEPSAPKAAGDASPSNAVRDLLRDLEQQVEAERTELRRTEAGLARARASLNVLEAYGRQKPTGREQVLAGLQAEKEALSQALATVQVSVRAEGQRGGGKTNLATFRRLSEALTKGEIRFFQVKAEGER